MEKRMTLLKNLSDGASIIENQQVEIYLPVPIMVKSWLLALGFYSTSFFIKFSRIIKLAMMQIEVFAMRTERDSN